MIVIDSEKCKTDSICVVACGRQIIQQSETDSIPFMLEADAETCILCGHCIAACPSEALSLQEIPIESCIPFQKDLAITFDQAEQFLKFRRSTRGFKDKAVEQEKLNRLIETASYAPSGHNARPVRWIVMKQREEVAKIAAGVCKWMEKLTTDSPPFADMLKAAEKVECWKKGDDRITRNAPHLVIAHAPSLGGTPHEDCTLSLSYLELAASAMGIGATWAGYIMLASLFDQTFMKALNLPEGNQPYGIMLLGYSKTKFKRIPPRDVLPVEWR